MIGGSLAVAVCLLLLGWTKEVVGLVVQDQGLVRAGNALGSVYMLTWCHIQGERDDHHRRRYCYLRN